MRYLKRIGLRTCMLLAARVQMPLWDDAWEPLWQAAAETGIPIGFHLGGGLRTVALSGPKAAHPGNIGVRVSCSPVQMDEALAAVIFSGALERYPSLKIVLAETGIGWLPYMLERMDDTYRKFLDAPDFWRSESRLALAVPPSAYFRRQIWATFQSDLAGMRLLDVLGEDRVMWASDYPHADSTWPDSQAAIEANFKSVPERARRRILCENAGNSTGSVESGALALPVPSRGNVLKRPRIRTDGRLGSDGHPRAPLLDAPLERRVRAPSSEKPPRRKVRAAHRGS